MNDSKTLSKIIWGTFLIVCLSGFLIMGYDCFQKYFSCPQAVQISTQPQGNVDFPSITFCPKANKNGYPQAYNQTRLESCGIDIDEKWIDGIRTINTQFSGEAEECKDPKSLWESVTPKLKDFGFTHMTVVYYDDTQLSFDMETEFESMWRSIVSYSRGICYTLTVPKDLREKPIFNLGLFMNSKVEVEIFLHSSGLLKHKTRKTLEYGSMKLSPKSHNLVDIEYQQKTVLDFAGKKCQSEPYYDYLKCVEDETHQKSLDKLDCTTPFANNLDKICINETKAKLASKLYFKVHSSSSCMYPCKHLAHFNMKVNSNTNRKNSTSLRFFFKQYIQTSTSKCTYDFLDLFAAVGGFLGLFLGFSIFEFKDGVTFLVRKWLQLLN